MNKSTNIEMITLDMKGAIVLDNGMMKIPATLTRVGVFNYMTPDGNVRKDFRPPEEVFDADSMASFELVPFVNNHPYAEGGAVTAENARRLTVGTVGGIHRNGDRLDGTVLISDADTIADVKAGKTALSCGYFNAREEKAGIFTDVHGVQHQYTHVQHKIRGNHVALVDVGRAGPEARLRLDSADAAVLVTDDQIQTTKETKIMKTLTLDSIPCEMSEASAAVVTKAIGDRDAKIVALQSTSDTHKDSLAAAMTKIDKMQATLDSAQADLKVAQDPARIQAMVASRVSLESSARKVLGDADLGKMTERQVKVAVVSKLKPSLNCDGKSDDYVTALYDDAMGSAKAGNVASEVVTAEIASGKAKVVETKVTTDAVEDPFQKMMTEARASKPWSPNQK
jgi:hypothetical protein